MTNLTIELPALQIEGRFKLIRRNADESIVWESDWMKNMVLNTGLNFIGGFYTGTWNLNGCQVGSSNVAVSAGQTGMQAFVAGTTSFTNQGVSSNTTYPNVYTEALGTWRFAVGVAAGNLSEVGIGIGTQIAPPAANSAGLASQPCFSRALIVDGLGVPTTITVLPTEILDVIYSVRVYAPSADVTGNFTVVTNGTPVNYTYTLRPSTNSVTPRWISSILSDLRFTPTIGSGGSMSNSGSGVSDGAIGSPLGALAPSSTGDQFFTNLSSGVYVSGNYFNDATWTLGVSNGNYGGGFKSLKFNFGSSGFMMEVSPNIPKLNTQQFVITMRVTWANLP